MFGDLYTQAATHVAANAWPYGGALATAVAGGAYALYRHYNSTDKKIREIFKDVHITEWNLPGCSVNEVNSKTVQPFFKAETSRNIDTLAEMIVRALSNGRISLPNIVLEGQPGVGKTVLVKHLCQKTNIGYIRIPTGAMENHLKLGTHIQTLHKIIDIAKSCQHPVYIVLDDGEELVAQRPTKTTEEKEVADSSAYWLKNQASLAETISQRRTALVNALLDSAGSEGRNYAYVITTNRPQVIDKAFLTRCSVMKIDPPGMVERKTIINRHLANIFTDLRILNFFDARVVTDMAASTEGFVGRDLVKLLETILTCTQMEKDITQEMIDTSIIQMQKSVAANKTPYVSVAPANPFEGAAHVDNSPIVVIDEKVAKPVINHADAKTEVILASGAPILPLPQISVVQTVQKNVVSIVRSLFQQLGCC